MFRVLLPVAAAVLATAQTLKAVTPLPTGPVTVIVGQRVSVSALGVGADGMTTYLEVGAETLALEASGTVTQTLLTGEIPFTATFLEDASRIVIGTTGSGLFESCTFGADGTGTCVNQFVDVGASTTSTLTTTFTGPVVPWYTLNAAAASGSPSEPITESSPPTSPTASNSGSSSAPSGSASTVPNNAAASPLRSGWALALVPVLLYVYFY
ncbi:hypothetical protein C8F01DRAFT_177573 [Mycena amicta]|nr:hypothetical protein C8F01DRAFT_177573 [Mycena amicta]